MNTKDKISIINKIRYVLFVPVILVIGIATSPLTLLFKWNGFYILCIAIYHWCSLSEAKKLFLENKDDKYTITYGSSFSSGTTNDLISVDYKQYSYSNDIVSNPAYSSLPCNVHHRNS
jgi:hypothetical protein